MKTERLNETSARALLDAQKTYFATGATRPLEFRLRQLQALYKALERHAPELEAALKEDLGKSRFESYTSEIGMVLAGISHIRRHLARWMKPRAKFAPVQLFPGRSIVEPVPYGCVYILGQLPGAAAAGAAGRGAGGRQLRGGQPLRAYPPCGRGGFGHAGRDLPAGVCVLRACGHREQHPDAAQPL